MKKNILMRLSNSYFPSRDFYLAKIILGNIIGKKSTLEKNMRLQKWFIKTSIFS